MATEICEIVNTDKDLLVTLSIFGLDLESETQVDNVRK